MRWSLATSLTIHVAILLAAVVVLPSPDEYEVNDEELVPVDIVTLEEFSKRQAKQEKPPEPEPEKKPAPKVKVEPEIKKIAPKPSDEIKQAAREPQPEPEPKPAPEPEPVVEQPPAPAPEPLEELIKKTEEVFPEPMPEPEPKEEASAPVPMPRHKPKPPVRKIVQKKKKKKKSEFNTDDVAALLNKIDETRVAPSFSDVLNSAPKPDDITTLIGSDDRISANELDWLRQRIGRCWNIPAGARDAENLVVKVQIQMDQLGNVTGQPQVVNRSNHPVFDAAARSAIAAIIGCQPYDKLPPEKYESWKIIRINFDPSLMLAIN